MQSSNNYVLKWNNFSQVLSFNFSTFLANSRYSDVTLVSDGRFVKGHRVILSAASTYFESLFDVALENQLVIVIDMSYENLIRIVEFAYKGEVTVDKDSYEGFVAAARKLKLKGIEEVPATCKEQEASVCLSSDDSTETMNSSDGSQEKSDKGQRKSTRKPSKTKEVSSSQLSSEDDRSSKDANLNTSSRSIKSETKKRKVDIAFEKEDPDDSLSQPTNQYLCNFCHKALKSTALGMAHETVCEKNRNADPSRCKFCQKVLSDQYKLARHFKTFHSDQLELSEDQLPIVS